MHKCVKCPNPATLHITEVMGQGKFEELHFCENCAQKYMQDPTPPMSSDKPETAVEPDEILFGNAECPQCGLKFVEFRNSGRLGCAHDYDVFREELLPLLENIHGDPRHCGKTPRRLPQTRQMESELTKLRTDLKSAVNREDYEAAASIRDQIKSLEEA